MSMQDVLDKIQCINDMFDNLQKEVDDLKTKNREKSTSSSPKRRQMESMGAGTSWGDRDPTERPSYREAVNFLDEEEESDLVEVLDETYSLLIKVCTQSVTNDERKAARKRYKLPKVPATRTPRLDPFLKTEIPQTAKSLDSDLARVQTLYMDALAPLTTLSESEELSFEDVRRATTTAMALIDNANSSLSRLRREKLVNSFNKSLLPLVKEDKDFAETTPYLFGADFAKRSKDFTDQIKAMRSTLPIKTEYRSSRPLFRKGQPPGRGTAHRGRGGGPSNFNRSHRGQFLLEQKQ